MPQGPALMHWPPGQHTLRAAVPALSRGPDVQNALPPTGADAGEESFDGVEVVGDGAHIADLPVALGFGDRCGDGLTRSLRSSRPPGCLRPSSSEPLGFSMFFVDIESDVEFIGFHMVCLHVRVSLLLRDSGRVPAQYGTDLADRPLVAARGSKNGEHTTVFKAEVAGWTVDRQP